MPSVLMYGWELPPQNSGGLGVACYGLTKGLASQGTKITFALPKKLTTGIPFMEILDHDIDGVEIHAINSLLEPYGTVTQYHSAYDEYTPTTLYAHDLYDEAYRFAESAYHWSANRQFDLVHGHDWMTYPASMLTAKKRSKPFVAHVHATEYDRTGGYIDTRIAEIEYQGLNQADQVIAVSEYTKNIIHDRYGVNRDKITTIHNGLDPVPFTSKDFRRVFPNDHVVLFVGRLTFQKGVEYFLKAAQEVLTSLPRTVFIIAGDGDLYHKHLMEAAYLGISNRVIFTGFLKGQELNNVYSLADVFVMPSVSEPFGIAALEAVAAGKPVIISKNSGAIEAISHLQTVDFWDTNLMASQIIQSLLYPKQSHFLNQEARSELKKISWNTAATKTLQVYQELLSNRKVS